MLRVTDRLLSLPRTQLCAGEDLRRFYRLLLSLGVDWVEVSVPVLEKLDAALAPARTVLRVETAADAARYPGFARYISRDDGMARDARFLPECGWSGGAGETASLRRRRALRLAGGDALLLCDYRSAFRRMRAQADEVEYCPGDRLGFATALAVEWAASGGAAVTASFLGRGGLAPLEEVMMALTLLGRGAPHWDMSVWAELKELYAAMTGDVIPPRKPVVGERIFHVESGVHVDGILKDASNYEPFAPETVGMKRTVQVGKHSGRATIAFKLRERGLYWSEDSVASLLEAARALSIRMGRGLEDAEFDALLRGAEKRDFKR